MPELPEVEVVRIGLEKSILGQKFRNVKVYNSKIVTSNSNIRIGSDIKVNEFKNGVIDKKITGVKRRAKNIIIVFEDNSVILIHLKMTGQLILSGEAAILDKHTHIIFTLADSGTLLYNDVRRFGYVLYFDNINSAKSLYENQSLGLEPFDSNFTYEYLKSKLSKINRGIKQVLLEQKVVVGCGNIYADEICFASNILPFRNCSTLSDKEISNLYKNIISILNEAIISGGSSISDYKSVNGESGSYATKHKVYGKAGKPCPTCTNILSKIIISGRSTVYCDVCQR